MDDFAGKISEILNDPESFEKIKSIASLLSSQNDGPAQAKEETNEAQKSPANETKTDEQSDSGSSGILKSDNISKLLPLLSEWSAGDNDPKIKLLYALKPYLSGDRGKRIDDAILVLKLSKIASKALDIL